MTNLLKPVPTPWKKINWKNAEESLKTNQAKLYKALKDGAKAKINTSGQ